MDTGKGMFVEISKEVAQLAKNVGMPIFEEGELITLKGSRFRIKSFGKEILILELLPSKSEISYLPPNYKLVDMEKEVERLTKIVQNKDK